MKCGVQLWDGLRVEDDVFIGPNATFANDPLSAQQAAAEELPGDRAACRRVDRRKRDDSSRSDASGVGAMVGAGAVVVESVPAYAIVAGNPARIVGYCDAGRAGRRKR